MLPRLSPSIGFFCLCCKNPTARYAGLFRGRLLILGTVCLLAYSPARKLGVCCLWGWTNKFPPSEGILHQKDQSRDAAKPALPGPTGCLCGNGFFRRTLSRQDDRDWRGTQVTSLKLSFLFFCIERHKNIFIGLQDRRGQWDGNADLGRAKLGDT